MPPATRYSRNALKASRNIRFIATQLASGARAPNLHSPPITRATRDSYFPLHPFISHSSEPSSARRSNYPLGGNACPAERASALSAPLRRGLPFIDSRIRGRGPTTKGGASERRAGLCGGGRVITPRACTRCAGNNSALTIYRHALRNTVMRGASGDASSRRDAADPRP